MEIREIKRLVFGGENENVEFKRKVNFPEKVVREVVAFANTTGGHLFVGVDDNGEIPGLKFAEEEDYVLQKAIKDLCRPAIKFESEMIELNEKRSILHYYIPSSKKKPHFAVEKKYQRYGKAFVRVEDKSIQASREVVKLLKAEKNDLNGSFKYGDSEKQLLNYLGDNANITLKQFQELAKISYKEASYILVSLALSRVIKIIPREKEDLFVFAE